MRKQEKQSHVGKAQFALLLSSLAAWQLIVAGNKRLEFLFGSPMALARIATEELSTHSIYLDSLITGAEALVGLTVGTFLGTLVGLALWIFPFASRVLSPFLVMAGAVPVIALAPMIIVWFGTGFASKSVIAAIGVFLIALAQVAEGSKTADAHYLMFAKSTGAARVLLAREIVVPAALHWVIAGFKLNVGIALLGAFIGEFISSSAGIGHYILKASSLYDMPRALFGTLLMGIIALILTAPVWLYARISVSRCRETQA